MGVAAAITFSHNVSPRSERFEKTSKFVEVQRPPPPKIQEERKERSYDPFDLYSTTSLTTHFLIYFGYFMLYIRGHIRELVTKIGFLLGIWEEDLERPPAGYASLFNKAQLFWLRRAYQVIRDNFERPIASVPGARIQVLERISRDSNGSFEFTGRKLDCMNLGSYNYLGFAENHGPIIDKVAASIATYGPSTGSAPTEAGTTDVVRQLEKQIAKFVGKPDAMVFAMGYATNSTTIAALTSGKGTLLLSDALNHQSLVCGSRDSGAVIRVFKHNDPADLERHLRKAMAEGKSGRPWQKILIICEGIYSMEGYIGRLPEIVALKKKYKAYLYVDEAHSIGALGATGRGVCEYTGVSPDDVDILMGTFTKSFGSVGGYISGSKELISYLRVSSYASVYATSMSVPCAIQALEALRIIAGEDGTDEGVRRIHRLKTNSNRFRKGLAAAGFVMCGSEDSPIVPVMMYSPSMMCYFSRALLARGVAVVIVGAPVTPMALARVRFCISASSTEQEIDEAIRVCIEVADLAGCRFLAK